LDGISLNSAQAFTAWATDYAQSQVYLVSLSISLVDVNRFVGAWRIMAGLQIPINFILESTTLSLAWRSWMVCG
jgi:hypothetical protein